jgi:hypothetical protein
MAIHHEKVDLQKESLLEMLHVAEYAVTYRKTDKAKWADNARRISSRFSVRNCQRKFNRRFSSLRTLEN